VGTLEETAYAVQILSRVRVHAGDSAVDRTVVELLPWTRAVALRVIARILLGRCEDDLLVAVRQSS
jgi:hypothetical protein